MAFSTAYYIQAYRNKDKIINILKYVRNNKSCAWNNGFVLKISPRALKHTYTYFYMIHTATYFWKDNIYNS